MRLLAFMITAFSALTGTANAWELTAIGGVNFAAPTQNTSGARVNWTGSDGLTYGALASFNLFNSPFEFESGLIEATQNTQEQISPVLNQSMHWLEIPLLVRFKLDPAIGIGVGGYLAYGQGSVLRSQGSNEALSSFSSVGLNNRDSGLLFNLRARFAFAPPVFLIVDGRYFHGLTNLATTGGSDVYNTRSIQIFGGISYEFKSSEKSQDQKRTQGKWTLPSP